MTQAESVAVLIFSGTLLAASIIATVAAWWLLKKSKKDIER